MLVEVETAVKFLSDFLRSKNNSNHGRQTVKKEQVEEFSKLLQQTLLERFQGHWHPAHPLRGSGYRCVINQSINGKIDPILLKVGRKAGIPEFLLRRYLPVEMAMWVDPSDVSYRIGEQGSVCSLMSPEKENDHGLGGRYAGSTVSQAGGTSSRTNSFSFSPRSLTPEKSFHLHLQQQQQLQLQQQQQQQQQQQERARLTSSDSLRTDSASNPEQPNDSGIELSPSSSPRPSANTISNSSSPSSSPLASPIREQLPSGISSCKEQFASRSVAGMTSLMASSSSSSSVSPSKVGMAAIHAAPLTSFVR